MPTTSAEWIAASSSLLTTILVRHQYTAGAKSIPISLRLWSQSCSDTFTQLNALPRTMSLHRPGADHVLTERDFVISSSKGICLVSFVDSARLKSLQLVLRGAWGLGMPAQSPYSHSTSAFNFGVSTIVCQLRTRHTAATGDTVPVLAFYLYSRELITVVWTALTTREISCTQTWRAPATGNTAVGATPQAIGTCLSAGPPRREVNCCFVSCRPSSCPAALPHWNHWRGYSSSKVLCPSHSEMWLLSRLVWGLRALLSFGCVQVESQDDFWQGVQWNKKLPSKVTWTLLKQQMPESSYRSKGLGPVNANAEPVSAFYLCNQVDGEFTK